jgi:hypothetical protein
LSRWPLWTCLIFDGNKPPERGETHLFPSRCRRLSPPKMAQCPPNCVLSFRKKLYLPRTKTRLGRADIGNPAFAAPRRNGVGLSRGETDTPQRGAATGPAPDSVFSVTPIASKRNRRLREGCAWQRAAITSFRIQPAARSPAPERGPKEPPAHTGAGRGARSH